MKFQATTIFGGHTSWFFADLAGNLEYGFAHVLAQFYKINAIINDFSPVLGAGHAGRGGRGSSQPLTGAPYDCLTHPVLHGCRGGSASVSGSTVSGGRGGGTIFLKNTGTMHNDGDISANGEAGTSAAGGGSGGAILMEIGLIKVHLSVCLSACLSKYNF